MKFVNLTPHFVRLRGNVANTAAEPDPADIVVSPCTDENGALVPARVPSTTGGRLLDFDGIAAYGRTEYGEVEGLPRPAKDTIYLVSIMFAGRVGDRDDVFIPGTGPKDGAVRYPEGDEKRGQIYAVTRLVQA